MFLHPHLPDSNYPPYIHSGLQTLTPLGNSTPPYTYPNMQMMSNLSSSHTSPLGTLFVMSPLSRLHSILPPPAYKMS